MHADSVSQEIKNFVIEKIKKNTIPQNLLDSKTKYHINPDRKICH